MEEAVFPHVECFQIGCSGGRLDEDGFFVETRRAYDIRVFGEGLSPFPIVPTSPQWLYPEHGFCVAA